MKISADYCVSVADLDIKQTYEWGVYSKTDLNIQLIVKNKIVCTNEEYSGGIHNKTEN